jgi:hypothetical protein
MNEVQNAGRRRILVCHVRRRIHVFDTPSSPGYMYHVFAGRRRIRVCHMRRRIHVFDTPSSPGYMSLRVGGGYLCVI